MPMLHTSPPGLEVVALVVQRGIQANSFTDHVL